jgi:methionyl-tRNA formyltransferase
VWTPKTLLITDPNLGDAAHALVAGLCADLTWISWNVAEPETRATTLARIADGRWELAISFYSDLVLTPAALEAIRLPLNIHPALPRIRGVGYDLLPLVENHRSIGATLHRMVRQIDSGEILHVHEVPLPPDQTYGSLRRLNQDLSMTLLEMLCGLMAKSGDLDILEETLRGHAARVIHEWGADYYSRQRVAAMRASYNAQASETAVGR